MTEFFESFSLPVPAWRKGGMGWERPGDDKSYLWGQWYKNGHDGELTEPHLRFWDWSQVGEDCCYGRGKWMPVTDQEVIASFLEEGLDKQ